MSFRTRRVSKGANVNPFAVNKPLHKQELSQFSREELEEMFLQLQHENEALSKQSNQQIQELRANLEAVIENSNDCIVAVNTSFQILICNSAYRWLIHEIYGDDPRPGDHILDQMDPDTKAFWRPLYHRAFSGHGELAIVEREVQGTIRHFEVALHPIHIQKGKAEGATIFIKDITDRKIVEETIRENQKMLVSINRNIKEGIYRSTPKEGLIYVNKAFLEMFGYESKEEMYDLPSDLLYVEPKRRHELMQLLVNGQEFHNEEVTYLRKDGTSFYGITSSLKWMDEEGSIFFDGAIRDMTEIIEAEHQLREQNEELIKVNEELDRFVYSTSHDLRAPLMSISGLIAISRMEESREKQFYYYDLMDQSINKLDNFIKDIISFSRNARTEVEVEAIDMIELIEQCQEELKFASESSQISFEREIMGESIIYADIKRLSVVLKNLLANAVLYHDLSKKNPFVKVKLIQYSEAIQIQIIENRKGMSPAILSKIFDMFYRGSNQSKGTGLGLYIAKESIEKIGGKITVVSEEGLGSTFTIHLPVVQAPSLEANRLR